MSSFSFVFLSSASNQDGCRVSTCFFFFFILNTDCETSNMSQDRTRKDSQSKSKDLCGKCDKLCTEKQDSLTCDLCGMWHHTKCEGVSQEAYKILSKENSGIRWYCKKCDSFATGFMQNMKHLSQRQDRLEKKFEDLQHTVGESIENLEERVEIKIEQVEKNIVNKAVSDSAREMKEREARKSNIIIFKAPMSEAVELKSRIEDDKAYFEKLCKEGLEIEEEMEVLKITRLGKKEDRDRPMRVSFCRSATALDFLKKAKNLKGKVEFKDVAIAGDRTPLEREERKKLIGERDRKQQEADTKGEGVKWIIRGERLVMMHSRDEEGAVGGIARRPREEWN